ncbi:ribosome-associated toxin RatA of RatAB toxin-antitoxin module [Chitinivorax tropicus]|uniref:Ribosome-associated toxin RatA of RatAB toxin-antitoxin module n=1 Tax=Chitinivorax tropicus TaxID=714531 RepID=A0A840MNP9_9PROT|nr:type II toxin-antitoxin system RatA family toxin [Chitinivorax tropicus]MBB5018709.1 ribosome-associated toxin RatA of RatAB toxin-antitoxin module [Chitinivorax tropicus]
MHQVVKTVLVEHTAQQMYHLVEAIEQYREFLPWCGGTQVLSRQGEETTATLFIDYHGLKHQFTTRNTNQPGQRIDMLLVDGPFQHLEGLWLFTPLGEAACKIEFKLSYEFSNGVLEKIIGPVFSKIANTFVDAFIRRADKVYAP